MEFLLFRGVYSRKTIKKKKQVRGHFQSKVEIQRENVWAQMPFQLLLLYFKEHTGIHTENSQFTPNTKSSIYLRDILKYM